MRCHVPCDCVLPRAAAVVAALTAVRVIIRRVARCRCSCLRLYAGARRACVLARRVPLCTALSTRFRWRAATGPERLCCADGGALPARHYWPLTPMYGHEPWLTAVPERIHMMVAASPPPQRNTRSYQHCCRPQLSTKKTATLCTDVLNMRARVFATSRTADAHHMAVL